jgi:hypothetical protein
MKAFLDSVKRQPVIYQTFVMATINLAVVLDLLHLTDVQLGGVNAFLAALLGIIVQRRVTPLARPRNKAKQPLVPAAPKPKPKPTS